MGLVYGRPRRAKKRSRSPLPRWRGVVCFSIIVLGTLPASLGAQGLMSALERTPEPAKELRGKPAVDIMPAQSPFLGLPLRHGNVVPGTVHVLLGTQSLKEGEDYTMDYGNGVLYLLRPARPYESVRVAYRYDPTAPSTSPVGGFSLLTLSFGGWGSLQLLTGLSNVQRQEGTLAFSNQYGFSNAFSFGDTTLQGLFLISDVAPTMVGVDGASPDQSTPRNPNASRDLLIRQLLQTHLLPGLTFTGQYQNVGAHFAGFGLLSSGGIDANAAKQLQAEKGIERISAKVEGDTGLGFQTLYEYQTIEEGASGIERQALEIRNEHARLFYSHRKIDETFTRFKDLAEADRQQWQKEKGISRTNFGGALQWGKGLFSFDQTAIEVKGDGIFRRTLSYQSPLLHASWLSQEISQNFTRVNDLAEPQKAQWAKERGFHREEITLGLPRDDKTYTALFEQKKIEYNDRGFASRLAGYDGSRWKILLWEWGADPDFMRLNDLAPSERDQLLQRTLSAYGAKVDGKDAGTFARQNGLFRRYGSIRGELGQSTTFLSEILRVQDGFGTVDQQHLAISSPQWKLDWRKQDLDPTFRKTSDLFEAEKKLFGNQFGLTRTDWSLSYTPDKNHGVQISQLQVGDAAGDLERITAKWSAPNMEIQGAFRKVEDSFTRALDLNDPERQLLSQLTGFQQYDILARYSPNKNLFLETALFEADSLRSSPHRSKRHALLRFAPDSQTQLALQWDGHRFQGGNSTSDNLLYDLLSFQGTRNLGPLGTLSLRREVERFDGTQAEKPDRHTTAIKYEKPLSPNAKISTEQVRTDFQDGGYENVQAYRLDYKVNDRLSLHAGHISVDRNPGKPDDRTHDVGFKYALGGGLVLGYTWTRDLNTFGTGRENLSWSLTEGELGGFRVGGSYGEQRQYQDFNQQTTAVGGFSLSHEKPFNWGPFQNVRVRLGYESKTERGLWQKENELAEFSASVMGVALGSSYTQILLPGEQRAIDRLFKVDLDPSGKKNLQARAQYKIRTLPNNTTQIIREYDLSYKWGDHFQLSHKLSALPEKQHGGVPFGTLAQPIMTRKWSLEYLPNSDTSLAFQFEDLMNSERHTLDRRTDLALTFFKTTGSPLRFRYGVEQREQPTTGRRTRHVYELAFDQKPGPHQSLSFIVGNVSWQHGIEDGHYWNSWTFRLDYQLRF
jgi:hypothetical protein